MPVLRRVAPAAARELLLTGEVFDAARALRIGLVNAVEPDLPAAVDRCVRSLLAGAPGALAGTKGVLYQGWDDSVERYAALLDISGGPVRLRRGQGGWRCVPGEAAGRVDPASVGRRLVGQGLRQVELLPPSGGCRVSPAG